MIYKFCPPNLYSLENLRSQALYCRHYSEFNDPFEFWSKIMNGVPSRLQEARFAAAMQTWGFTVDSGEDHEEYFLSLEYSQPPFKTLFDYTRIACFGKENNDLLMWSHYAEGLRGFCIGFDEQELLQSLEDVYLTDVKYLQEPPVVDAFVYAVALDQYEYNMSAIEGRERNEAYFGKDPITDEQYKAVADESFEVMTNIWRRAFAVKPTEWKYEKECRLLFRTGNEDIRPILQHYPISAVRKIILGERIESEYQKQLLEITKLFPQVDIFHAKRSQNAYQLELVPLTLI